MFTVAIMNVTLLFSLYTKYCVSMQKKSFMILCVFQSIYISRVTEGGAAEKDGKIQVGDRIVSVSTDDCSLSSVLVCLLHLE